MLAANTWTPVRYLLEKGVCLQRGADNFWRLNSLVASSKLSAGEVNSILDRASLRPIVRTAECPPNGKLHTPLTADRRPFYDPGFWRLQSNPNSYLSCWALEYPYAALHYHLRRLAKAYCTLTERFAKKALGSEFDTAQKVVYGSQFEPWFEFDAAVTAGRRVYDALRYPLWLAYRGKQRFDDMPRSLPRLIRGDALLPDQLSDLLLKSWETFGRPLKEYRDCVHHFVPVSFGMGSAHLELVEGALWTVRLLIPDNPEVQATTRFRYTLDRDALDYVWQMTCELHRVLLTTIVTVEGDIGPGKV